ncbi:MAG: hypothetical protein AAB575_04985 [Patescibacteria group bacterium]
MFGFEKIFPRKEETGMDKAATELGAALKDVPAGERSLLKKLIEELNEFLKKDYEASL